MKVIDLSPTPPQGNSLSALIFKTQNALGNIFGLKQEIKAQETLITQLGKTLNNRFTIIRNFKIDGLPLPIPLILIGPTGLYVIYTSALKGIFQAKNESWLIASKANSYAPARPNLITRTSLMTKELETVLDKQSLNGPEIQGVLFFSNPGIHVDAQRPTVRIVLMDGVERFVTSLLQGELKYEKDEVQTLVTALTEPGGLEKKEALPFEETGEVAPETKPIEPPREPLLGKNINAVSERFPLTTRQWVLLGIMGLVEIIILIAFILIILRTLR
jgi:hypothetical protein